MPPNYGYQYNAAAPKVEAMGNQSNYNTYGYTGYGYGGYGQVPVPGASARSAATTVGSIQSLYASAVSEKPQSIPATISTTAVTTVASDPAVAATAYASYYYGASTGTAPPQGVKYDAAVAAAQQFNAWRQQNTTVSGSTPVGQLPTTLATAAASGSAAYTSYYQGYPNYPAGYGSVPATAAASTGGASNTSNPAAAQTMPPYYGGYR